MQSFWEALFVAWRLVLSFDSDLVEIVGLSLYVSITATVIASLAGVLSGAVLALSRFRGRGVVLVIVNALMGLPPVVVGLLVYLYLSRSGPLGFLGLLYTPTAMIIAQAILITPII
ncbi:MAG: ABC transporter permease, partial [Pseudomonadota bacterium]